MDKLLFDCSAADHRDHDFPLDLLADVGLVFGCHFDGMDIPLTVLVIQRSAAPMSYRSNSPQIGYRVQL